MPQPSNDRALTARRRTPLGRRLAALAGVSVLATVPLLTPGLSAGLQAHAAATVAPTAASGAPTRAVDEPLAVEITEMSPAIPAKGRLRLSGTVTNNSAEPYTLVNTHAVISYEPITDPAILAATTELDPTSYIADRITVPGSFDTLEVLEPGQSVEFEDSIRVRDLPISGAEGIYSIGVQALGSTAAGRDNEADGRARTFVPLVRSTKPAVNAAVVVPLRAAVWHRPDGAISHLGRWTRLLSPGGRLHDLLAFDQSSETLSWLVDPAVLAAITRISQGNPARSLDPAEGTEVEPGTETPEPETAGSPMPRRAGDAVAHDPVDDTVPTPLTPPAIEDKDRSADVRAAAIAATAWLEAFRAAVADEEVLALPYGDLDVTGAVRHAPGTLDVAIARSSEVMGLLGISARPAVAPRSGAFDAATLAAVPAGVEVLLADSALTPGSVPPGAAVDLAGHPTIITTSGATDTQTVPQAATEPLLVRQRLLSEAALRVTNPLAAPASGAAENTRPAIVLVAPTDWDPVEDGGLLDDLDLPWLRERTLSQLASRPGAPLGPETLVANEESDPTALPDFVFRRGADLADAAELTEQVLTNRTTVTGQATDEILVNLSENRRSEPQKAAFALSASETHLLDLLAGITLEVPPAVTLTAASGTIGATVVNDMDQPVTIRIAAESDGDLTLADDEIIELSPERRRRVLLDVSTTRQGRHNVVLTVTSIDGTPLGSRSPLPIRAAVLDDRVWIVVGIGTAGLFVLVVFRIVRRIRRVRAGEPVRPPLPTNDPPAEAGDHTSDGGASPATEGTQQ